MRQLHSSFSLNDYGFVIWARVWFPTKIWSVYCVLDCQVKLEFSFPLKCQGFVWFVIYPLYVDYDRIIKNIERGEARITRKDEIMKAIGKKLDRYKNPWLELKIQYGQNKGKLYNEECDRFMVPCFCFLPQIFFFRFCLYPYLVFT